MNLKEARALRDEIRAHHIRCTVPMDGEPYAVRFTDGLQEFIYSVEAWGVIKERLDIRKRGPNRKRRSRKQQPSFPKVSHEASR
jgi:hypothetical protein